MKRRHRRNHDTGFANHWSAGAADVHRAMKGPAGPSGSVRTLADMSADERAEVHVRKAQA